MKYQKWLFGSAMIALLFAILPWSAWAQQTQAGAAVTQTGARGDAATNISTSATSAATLTLNPTSGQSVYVTNVHITNCAGAAAVTAAAVTTTTTTNLGGGTTPVWTHGSGTTAGACQPEVSDSFPGGLKATAPGAVTFVLPTFATNQTIRVQVSWYSAP